MPTRVQLPDGNIGEFPDGMSQQQIESVLSKQFPSPSASPVPSHVQQLMARTPSNYASQVAGNIAGGIGDVASGLYQTVRHPINTATGLAAQTKQFANTPEDEASWQGNLLKTAEQAPIIGGLVQQAEKGGTQAGSPEAIGAGVRAATMVAAPALAAKGVAAAVPAVRAAASSAGDANAVYHSYLDPVADTPHPMPDIAPKMKAKLVNAIRYTDPDLADRVQSGNTTLGDLDKVRIEANQMGAKAYKDTGPMAAATARGAADAATALREAIYPRVENLHGLPDGSLADVKQLEGSALNITQKSPKWQYYGYRPEAYIPVAVRKALDATRLGVNRLQTSALSESLPKPK